MAKDSGLAVVLTLLFPGLGHVYLERYLPALLISIGFIISVALISAGIGILLAPAVLIFAAYDAHKRA